MKKTRWFVSPEIAGELGDKTEMDSSIHPPRVSRLHHRIEGWLGDDLLETFPCFLVSAPLAKALQQAGLGGFSLDNVEVSVSPEFQERYPARLLPEFLWLKITGTGPDDDFSLTPDFRLEISDRTLEVLKKFNITHAEISRRPET